MKKTCSGQSAAARRCVMAMPVSPAFGRGAGAGRGGLRLRFAGALTVGYTFRYRQENYVSRIRKTAPQPQGGRPTFRERYFVRGIADHAAGDVRGAEHAGGGNRVTAEDIHQAWNPLRVVMGGDGGIGREDGIGFGAGELHAVLDVFAGVQQ